MAENLISSLSCAGQRVPRLGALRRGGFCDRFVAHRDDVERRFHVHGQRSRVALVRPHAAALVAVTVKARRHRVDKNKNLPW
jgi:hypothetical protein